MAGDWQEGRWGDIATLEYGKGLRGYQEATGAYRVFGTNGPIGWHDEPLCPFPSVIIGRKGAYRGIHFSPEPFFVIDTAFYLKPKEDFNVKWAYYELLTHDINSMDSGSAIPSTSRESFYQLPVLVPPNEDQQAIAHILGSLDDKIELNRRMNETLEATARAIFKSWFVDFDPVRAKVEGRPTGLPDDIAALFPDSFEDSELGEIPRGWGISDLGVLSHILNGFAFKSKDYCGPEGIRVLRTKNFTKSGYVSKNTDDVFLPESFLSSHKQYICEPFDFHLVMVGASVGNTALLLPNMLPALRNQNMWCFRPKETMQSKFYLNYAVQRKVESVLSWADGSARSFFRKSDFRKHKIIVPTEDLLNLFEVKIKDYFELIAANTAENETLASLRDALLPKLISGELRVPDAEKFVEEAGV